MFINLARKIRQATSKDDIDKPIYCETRPHEIIINIFLEGFPTY